MRMMTRTALAALAALTLGGAAQAETMRLMTGPQGGVWVPLGGQLKDMWEKAIPGLSVQSMPGAGIANVRGIEEGKTEVGFGNSISTVDALTGAAERFSNSSFQRSIARELRSWRPLVVAKVKRTCAAPGSVAALRKKAARIQDRMVPPTTNCLFSASYALIQPR